ncbi:alpha/beta fold hydrolase [Streptomyces purpurogeneiscleroticus]|uniref:alpha/beta fold hydrolase n=1 Tax=Streptomyces purpurogeneiscleroticus TaxID=68259 RepID=UPI001CC09EA4|nr:alpha/beta hydrolase [Streptomyces purpurogeneiscleroticus]MBZ4016964.1 alpha/beta hydrolase [Streptomyces purpurogeneiscleroticus]
MGIAELDGGVRIAYEDRGEGPPVLLVHGHPFDRTMWAPQTAFLVGSGFRVVVPDLRGYGGSPATGPLDGLADFSRDLAALLDHLGIAGPVILGGLSMGGQIALDFCRLFPERVRGLLLADTSAPAETTAGREWRNAMADRLLREGLAPYADEVLDKMIAPQTITDRPEVAAHVHRMMRGTPPEGAAAALRGRAERPDYTALLPRITVPALVVVGSADTYTPLADAQYLHDRLPDSALTVVEGAAHMPNLERPGVFNAALAELLRRSIG